MKIAKNIRLHARRRALQRYGVNIGKRRRQGIINLIHANKVGRFVRKHSIRVTEWEIPFDGEVFRVLYDKKRKEIITFLPPSKKPNV